jgi:hypothetical protein
MKPMSPGQWQATCTYLKMRADQALKLKYPELAGGELAMRLYSGEIDSRPMVAVMRVDGKAEKRVRLIDLPAGAMLDFLQVMTDMRGCHDDWATALRIVDSAFESNGV